jgi:hypothetical protein
MQAPVSQMASVSWWIARATTAPIGRAPSRKPKTHHRRTLGSVARHPSRIARMSSRTCKSLLAADQHPLGGRILFGGLVRLWTWRPGAAAPPPGAWTTLRLPT